MKPGPCNEQYENKKSKQYDENRHIASIEASL